MGLRAFQKRLSTWDFVGPTGNYRRGTSWGSKEVTNVGFCEDAVRCIGARHINILYATHI